MVAHFNKLRAPLYPIRAYPSLVDQENRFKKLGWQQACARNLWDLWSDDVFLDGSSRESLDAVEPFDEWEEFALFASHYFLLVASTTRREKNTSSLMDHDIAPTTTTAAAAASDINCNNNQYPGIKNRFTFEFASQQRVPAGSGPRRHGSLVPDSVYSLGHHGGLGRHSTRLASTDLYTSSSEEVNVLRVLPRHAFPPGDLIPRVCHTITPFNDDNDCLLVGGRASPSSALSDCWLREQVGGQWHPTHNLPIARFRHSAVKLVANGGTPRVLVYGGKTSNGNVLDDWLVWDKERGWQEIEVITRDGRPRARFGACLEKISDASAGIVFGGIGQDGTVCEDFWGWEVCEERGGNNSSIFVVKVDDCTERMRSRAPQLFKYLNRFGATINPTSSGLIVAGGIIARRGVLPFDKEIVILDRAALLSLLFAEPEEQRAIISTINLPSEFKLKQQRPLLTGHITYTPRHDQLLLLGGGAICFSFGTFLTEGTFLLDLTARSVAVNTWRNQAHTNGETKSSVGIRPGKTAAYGEKMASISRVRVETASQFEQIVASGKPVIIEGCDIGPCTSLWTKEYLAETVGSVRKVCVPFFFFFAPLCLLSNSTDYVVKYSGTGRRSRIADADHEFPVQKFHLHDQGIWYVSGPSLP